MIEAKECPRCHRNCLDKESVMNSISHVGDNIEICTKCGEGQGSTGMYYSIDIVEVEMEKRFRKELEDK